MARRSRRPPVPLPRGAAKFLLLANVIVAAVLGGWYLVQPAPRQAEVRRLVENAFARDKQVSPFDVAWDVWQLYYAGGAVGRVAPGDRSLVYGGEPRPLQPGPASPSFRVLVNRGYVVGYSEALASPVWAAYRVPDLPALPRPAPRPDKFEVDRRTVARIAGDVYSGSGYDRGHLAPNYAIATRHGAQAQRETFLMSNIAPQRPGLNGGLWRDLEMKIATSYPARYGEVWVLTGPVFGARPERLRGTVAVPEAFFLIVIDEQDGRLRTLALLVPQEAPSNVSPDRYLTTIAEIQRRTGLDFLAELEDESERQVEQVRASRVW